ncbi:hypothetical protein D3C72_1607090 [compost metagenome]
MVPLPSASASMAPGSVAALRVRVAPTREQVASVSSTMSTTVTWLAPASRAAIKVSAPMGPAPTTITDLPSRLPALRTACSATASGSPKAASSNDKPSGTGRHCLASTTTCSRIAPCMCGYLLALPKKCTASQWLESPWRQ